MTGNDRNNDGIGTPNFSAGHLPRKCVPPCRDRRSAWKISGMIGFDSHLKHMKIIFCLSSQKRKGNTSYVNKTTQQLWIRLDKYIMVVVVVVVVVAVVVVVVVVVVVAVCCLKPPNSF